MNPPKAQIQTVINPLMRCVSTFVGSRTSAADYKLIPLTQGQFVIVDDFNYDLLSLYKWYAVKSGKNYYARRTINLKNKTFYIYMHQILIKAKVGEEIDHINRNSLDNRICNLRSCSHSKNNQNSRKRVNASSTYKGVHKADKKWRVIITFMGKRVHLGRYENEIEAAKVYDVVARELFGEFACTNF